MAIAYVSSTNANNGTSGASTLTFSSSLNTTQGNVVIVNIAARTGSLTISSNNGNFVALGGPYTGTNMTHWTFYRVNGASESSSTTFNLSSSAVAIGAASWYSGCTLGTGVIDKSNGRANSSSTSISTAGMTTNNPMDMLVFCGGLVGTASTRTISAPTSNPGSFTAAQANPNNGSSTSYIYAHQSYYSWSSSGATGATAATASIAGVNSGFLVALSPQLQINTSDGVTVSDPSQDPSNVGNNTAIIVRKTLTVAVTLGETGTAATYNYSDGSEHSVTGTVTWTNSQRFDSTPDSLYATTGSIANSSIWTEAIVGNIFDYSVTIPTDADITGISAEAVEWTNIANVATDGTLRIQVPDSSGLPFTWSSDKADRVNPLPTVSGTHDTYGGSQDKWGLSYLRSPNASGPWYWNFQYALKGYASTAGTANADAVMMKVSYWNYAQTRYIDVKDSITVSDVVKDVTYAGYLSGYTQSSGSDLTSPSPTIHWVNPQNANGAPDNNYATATFTGNSQQTYYLNVSMGAGALSFPSGAVVSDIIFNMNCATAGGATATMISYSLVHGGVLVGNAQGGQSDTMPGVKATVTHSFTAATLGTGTDSNWYSDASFGLAVQAKSNSGAGNGTVAQMDAFWPTVKYTLKSAFTTLFVNVRDSITVSESTVEKFTGHLSANDAITITENATLTFTTHGMHIFTTANASFTAFGTAVNDASSGGTLNWAPEGQGDTLAMDLGTVDGTNCYIPTILAGQISKFLMASDFVPSTGNWLAPNETITGVQIALKSIYGSTVSTTIKDHALNLYRDGAFIYNVSDYDTWPIGPGAAVDEIYGTDTSTWNTTWNNSDFNDGHISFGISVSGVNAGTGATAYIDALYLTVYTNVSNTEVYKTVRAKDSITVSESITVSAVAPPRNISVSDSITATDVTTMQLMNHYTYAVSSTLSNVIGVPFGAIPWVPDSGTLASCLSAQDTTYVTATLTGSDGVESYTLKGLDLYPTDGRWVPEGVSIYGIALHLNGVKSFNDLVSDDVITLYKNDAETSNLAFNYWGSQGVQNIKYGGISELWSTTWNSDSINNGLFGFGVSTVNYDGLEDTDTALLDYVYIDIYTTPETGQSNRSLDAVTISESVTLTLKTVNKVSVSDSITVSEDITLVLKTVNQVSVFDSVTISESSAFTFSSITTSSQTQVGKARIQVTSTQTQTGIARVQVTSTQIQTGKARIQITSSHTQTGKACIRATSTQTQTGKARIRVTTDQTQPGKSRVVTTATHVQTGKAAIYGTTQQTQTAVVSVRNTTLQTQSALARIRNTTSRTHTAIAAISNTTLQTLTGIAYVTSKKNKYQDAIADIAGITKRTQTAVAFIIVISTQTQSAIARIRKTTKQTQAAVASIKHTELQFQNAVARIRKTQSHTQPAQSRIQVTQTKTQPAVAYIVVTTKQTQPAIARLRITSIHTITGKANIYGTTLHTQPAASRISTHVDQTQAAIARIRKTVGWTHTAIADIYGTTQKTKSAIARLRTTAQQFETAIVRIRKSASQQQYAIARIQNTLNQHQIAVARMQNTSTQLHGAVARIQKTASSTQDAISRIQVSTLQLQSGIADIYNTTVKIQYAVARIQITSSTTQNAISRIQIISTQAQLGIADIYGTTQQLHTAIAYISPRPHTFTLPRGIKKRHQFDGRTAHDVGSSNRWNRPLKLR